MRRLGGSLPKRVPFRRICVWCGIELRDRSLKAQTNGLPEKLEGGGDTVHRTIESRDEENFGNGVDERTVQRKDSTNRSSDARFVAYLLQILRSWNGRTTFKNAGQCDTPILGSVRPLVNSVSNRRQRYPDEPFAIPVAAQGVSSWRRAELGGKCYERCRCGERTSCLFSIAYGWEREVGRVWRREGDSNPR